MKLKVPMSLKSKALKAKLTIGKHSPEILLVTGIVGVVASAVMACVATVKAADVVEEANDAVAEAKNEYDNYIMFSDAEKEKRKKIYDIYVKTGLNLAKLYFPSVLVGSLSICSIVGSNGILKKRNAELAAAYSALSLAYGEYRRRVTEALGEDADSELALGIKKKENTTIEIDPETGEAKETRKDILDVVEDDIVSPYAFWFERPNVYAEESLNGNLMFLEHAEKKVNLIFNARSDAEKPMPVFLNEVLELVGISLVPIGQFAGWFCDPNNPNVDNAIKFRPKVVKKPDGFGGYKDAILLDFNVDGDVLSKWYDKSK